MRVRRDIAVTGKVVGGVNTTPGAAGRDDVAFIEETIARIDGI